MRLLLVLVHHHHHVLIEVLRREASAVRRPHECARREVHIWRHHHLERSHSLMKHVGRRLVVLSVMLLIVVASTHIWLFVLVLVCWRTASMVVLVVLVLSGRAAIAVHLAILMLLSIGLNGVGVASLLDVLYLHPYLLGFSVHARDLLVQVVLSLLPLVQLLLYEETLVLHQDLLVHEQSPCGGIQLVVEVVVVHSHARVDELFYLGLHPLGTCWLAIACVQEVSKGSPVLQFHFELNISLHALQLAEILLICLLLFFL
jgi:hypothetical protein